MTNPSAKAFCPYKKLRCSWQKNSVLTIINTFTPSTPDFYHEPRFGKKIPECRPISLRIED